VDCIFLLIVFNQLIVYYFSYGKYIMSAGVSELTMVIDRQCEIFVSIMLEHSSYQLVSSIVRPTSLAAPVNLIN
jgi:hypothetical protein